MCWVVHVAHGRCLSVVVQIIDEFDVLPNEPEDHAPITVDCDRVKSPEFAGQGVQAPPRRCEIFRLRRGVQCRELQPEFGRVLWLDSGLGPALEESCSANIGSGAELTPSPNRGMIVA